MNYCLIYICSIAMPKIFWYLKEVWSSTTVRKKLFYTLAFLLLYRLLVFIPVPYVNIDAFVTSTLQWTWGLEFFAMLLWWSLEQFSIIAVWLIPYINASIIMQLLTSIVPKLEELQEQGETGTQKIQQYTRLLAVPFAFLQSIWMIYFINYLLGGNIINTASFSIVLLTAFALTVWTILLMWIWELITEKGLANWISLIIFSSIIAWMSSTIYTNIAQAWSDIVGIILFMLFFVIALLVLAIFITRSKKEIPVVYARQWKMEESAVLPFALNPVWMIPIIFSIAFISFPYLMSQLVVKFGTQNQFIADSARWIENHLNIYTQTPSLLTVVIYFLMIVCFTFFYTIIVFNPSKIADNIQKRGWFIPWIRPWEETADYINKMLTHLCLWWGVGLWLIWIYSYVLSYIPFIQQATQSLWSIPVIISWSWVVIIVWVVQDIINKINAEISMERYDRI